KRQYYYLSHTPVIEGSESILIETRDRYRPDIVIRVKKMSYGQDYWIDYYTGAILFKFPIPSMDINFNPVFIIVSYESEIEDKKYNIFGGRLTYKPVENLEIGLTSITEEKEIDNYNLLGTDIKVKLPLNTIMRVEFAKTHSLFNIDGIYTPKDGKGYLFEIKSSPNENLSISAYYKKTDDYFDNISATEIMRGSEKYGADFNYFLKSKNTSIYGKYFNEKDKLNDTFYENISLGFGKKFESLKFRIETYYEHSNNKYIPPTNPTSRYPFDISEYLLEESLGLKFSIEKKFSQNFTFIGEYKSNLLSNAGNMGHIGLEYNLEKNRKIYFREFFAKFEERLENRGIFGIESEIFTNTVAFNEYRLLDGIEGRSLQQSIGLRNRFLLGENITGNISIENLHTLKGQERKNQPDAFAIGVGFEYLPKEHIKVISRLEYRNETDGNSKLGELGCAYKYNPSWTFFMKERFYSDRFDNTSNINSKTLLGFAYRPIDNDKFNAIGKVELKREENSSFKDNSYIFSFEGLYQLNEKTQISGKYAGKFVKSLNTDTYTDLIGVKITRDLNNRFDISAEYRILRNNEIGSISHGGSLEIGYSIFKNIYLSFGYSFDKFDNDLRGDFYYNKGPFIRLRIKFSENSFNFFH
ncbi:MAG: DUF481 domain-containing protein, partial [bacterium]|nr:DUF481 domain-containing protein [bacterium]